LQALPNASANADAGNLDVLRNSRQFQNLLSLVQANPQILQVLFHSHSSFKKPTRTCNPLTIHLCAATASRIGQTKSPGHSADPGKPSRIHALDQ